MRAVVQGTKLPWRKRPRGQRRRNPKNPRKYHWLERWRKPQSSRPVLVTALD